MLRNSSLLYNQTAVATQLSPKPALAVLQETIALSITIKPTPDFYTRKEPEYVQYGVYV